MKLKQIKGAVLIMLKAKVFQTDKGQAILLPKSLKTQRKEFGISENGDFFILAPVEDPMRPFRQIIGTFPEDFMEDRNQPMLNVNL